MYLLKEFDVYDRPGYFGKKRTEKEAEYNKNYLFGWHECWQVRDMVYNFFEAVMLYEDAYYEYLKSDPKLLEWVTNFTECYDNSITNIEDGSHYDVRAPVRHLQDVSVRRSLMRMGLFFRGTDPINLLQIRGPESNGHLLMPGNVKFHRPEFILQPSEAGAAEKWVKPGTVEEFWQRNKLIGKPRRNALR
jgi:hypothetical protein